MSKVVTFSRVFPAYHPKAGQPTYFVEQIYNSIYKLKTGDWSDAIDLDGTGRSYVVELDHLQKGVKNHTIRVGDRFKVGDKFSPRIWSGKPYTTKQIIIAPDIEIKKIWKFEIRESDLFIDGVLIFDRVTIDYHTQLGTLAKNDGLSTDDLLDWFQYPKPFKGQIICWNENIVY